MSKVVSHSTALVLLAVAAACARHSGDIAAVDPGSIPAFETRIEIETGSDNHADYHVADFTGDGVLDMAVISLTGELRILVGNGASFVESQSLQIDGLPIWMSGGDLDNDGDEDLVIVRSDVDQTNIWRNDGAGGFSMTTEGTLDVGDGALSVAVGDLNGDGIPDVAVSQPSAPEIKVGFSDGALGFSSVQDLLVSSGGIPYTLAIGDGNRDGFQDLVVADTSNSRVVIFEGTGATVGFAADVCELDVAGTAGAVTFGDLNGDGLSDMVVSAFNANRFVVVTEVFAPASAATGGRYPACEYSSFDVDVPAQPTLAKVGDVTGDGINDLVACLGGSASICVATGVADNSIGELTLLDATDLPLRPFIGRFDNNDSNDVFALSGNGNRVNLWLGRTDGPLVGARNFASGLSGASWVEGGDFDLDGDFEIVTGSNDDTELAIMGGTGELSVQATIDVEIGVHQIKAEDLDLDGKIDLVVAVEGGIRILRNNSTPGDYSFELLAVSPASVPGSYPFGIEIGDFDRDGDQDIAVCDYAGGDVCLVPGTPEPFVYEPEIRMTVGGGPIDIVAADFTGDGLQDFAVSRSNQSDIAILRNEGSNEYLESIAVPVGQSPNYLVTSDFNNDGRADLVVSNAVSGSVSVLFGTTNGFAGSDFAAGLSPTALLARDLTGDGVEDILVASLESGDFRVLVGDGQGGFPLLPTFPGTLGASDAVLQDMTGDGLPDLVVSSLVTDRVSLVRNASEAAPNL
jgi:hypothetical protein